MDTNHGEPNRNRDATAGHRFFCFVLFFFVYLFIYLFILGEKKRNEARKRGERNVEWNEERWKTKKEREREKRIKKKEKKEIITILMGSKRRENPRPYPMTDRSVPAVRFR